MSRPTMTSSEALREGGKLAARGQLQEAAELFNAVLRSDPGNKKAKKALRELQKTSNAALTRADFERVTALMGAGRLDAARAETQRLCRLHPAQPALFNLLGVILARQDRREEAVEQLREALRIEPGFNDALTNLASVLHELGRDAESVRCYQELVKRGEQSAELYNGLAQALRGAGLYEDGLEACRRALALRPVYPDALNSMGNLLNEVGRHAEAIEAYERAVEFDAGHDKALINLAQSLHTLRRHNAALKYLGRYLEKAPKDALALRLAANSMLGIGQITAAREKLEALLAIKPEDRVARHLLNAVSGRGTGVGDPEYARAVFDSYAARFEQHLTQTLEYRVPERLPALLQALDGDNAWYERVLDLGCGTGLVGSQIRGFCSHLTGVDVSAAMVERAGEKAVYDDLVVDDLLGWLNEQETDFDLVLCIDVLLYVGKLESFLGGAARRMAPGARLIFTTEQQAEQDLVLRPTGRYAHSAAYVQRCVEAAGLTLMQADTIRLRKEKDDWLEGGLFCVEKARG